MLRSVFSKTLREQRWALLIWSLLIIGFMILGYWGYNQIDPAEISKLVANPAFKFLNDPVAVETPSGLVTFRYGFFFSLLLSIFAVLLGGRLLRAEEARGSLDLILTRPQSRRTVLLEKAGAAVAAVLILGIAYGVGALLGEMVLGIPVTIAGALLAGLNLSLLLFFYAMLALTVSQATRSSGTAAGIAGGLYAIFFVLDGTGRIYPGIHWIRWFSPNYYYDLSKPLITSYGTNVAAMFFLLLLGVLLLMASLALFARRDIGAVVSLPFIGRRARRYVETQSAEASIDRAARDPWLRSVLTRSLRATGPALGWWTLGVFLYAAYGAAITKSSGAQLRDLYSSASALDQIVGSNLFANDNGLISFMVFMILSIVVAVYALVRSNGWVSDQDEGRLDLVLSAPQSRWKVALQAYAAILIGFAVLTLATIVGVTLIGLATGLKLNYSGIIVASLAFLPLMAVIAGAVFMLGARFRSGVVLAGAGGYLGVAFFLELIWSYLGLPHWIQYFSIFSDYGTPSVDGINWAVNIIMLALAAIATAAGIYLFQTGDLRQGG